MIGLEPITCWLQISCSANWATSAYKCSADWISFTANDSNGNRTRVTAVKGRCLNRLTMEPYIHLSLCFSHDRDLIYHRLGCLASVFLKFPKNFYFSDFFLFFADIKSFTCFWCPHLVRFIIVITNPYVPYRSVWYKIKRVTSESDLTCPCRHLNY